MKKLLVFLAVLLICMVPFAARAADMDYRFTHNDHDTLLVGTVTGVDGRWTQITAAGHVVSVKNLNESAPRKQLTPQVVAVDLSGREEVFAPGDTVAASLNKKGTTYRVANGIYKTDGTDYRTLRVLGNTPEQSAMLTDFINSGGVYTEYAVSQDGVVRRDSGVDMVVYKADQGAEKMLQVNSAILETQTRMYPIVLFGIITLGVIAFLFISLKTYRRKKK